MASNTENAAWHALHDGKRVPISDLLGNPTGNPAALGWYNGQDAWKEGSLNWCTFNNWEGTVDADDQADFDAGSMDLKKTIKYVNRDQLYGFRGDALNTIPGDMMSFRGYPTATVTTEEFSLAVAASNVAWEHDGDQGGGPQDEGQVQGQYIITRYLATIEKKLSYSLEWTITYIPPEGMSASILVTVRITAGQLNLSQYKLGDNPDDPWLFLPQNAIFFSSDSAVYSGDATMTCRPTDIIQEPTYGVALTEQTVVVPEDDYNGVTPSDYYAWTYAIKSPRILVDCTLDPLGCSEYPYSFIEKGTDIVLYAKMNVEMIVGAQVYSSLGGYHASAGTYVNANWVYSHNGVEVWNVTRVIILDSSGIITTIASSPGNAYCYRDGNWCYN